MQICGTPDLIVGAQGASPTQCTNWTTASDLLELRDSLGTVLSSDVGSGGSFAMDWTTPAGGTFALAIRNVGTCSFTPDALRNCTSTCDGIPVSRTQAGAVAGSYQYRRYQTGASPLWTPLRFPGQYYDAETDLAENWNRYYDSSAGRYLQPERMLQEPSYVKQAAKDGRSAPGYSYTFNNPIAYTDPDGLQTCPPGSSCEGCTFNGECWVCPAGKSPRGGMPLCVEGEQPYKPPDPETLKPQVQCEPDNPIGKKLQNPSGGPVGVCIAMCRGLSRGNHFQFAACVVAVFVPVAFRH